MQVEVCIPDAAVRAACAAAFSEESSFAIVAASITDASCDTIVSAGNSFGEMNGGVDGIINTHLSSHTADEYVQERVKRAIDLRWRGELPVGAAVVVRTAHPRHLHLVYAPTMRVPAACGRDSLAAYLAFRGALVAAERNSLTRISTPMMCTGAGEMAPERAARQMVAAYKYVFRPETRPRDLSALHVAHRNLFS